MCWTVTVNEYKKEDIEKNGNRFLLANGYMGYRGTLEEHTERQRVACVLSGLYDKVGDKWREPVVAPNGLSTRLYCDGELLSVDEAKIKSHRQTLNMKNAIHQRETAFLTRSRKQVNISTERFLSGSNVHLMSMKYVLRAFEDCEVELQTGIDSKVWDLNGPHLEIIESGSIKNYLVVKTHTHELKEQVVSVEAIEAGFGIETVIEEEGGIYRSVRFHAEKDSEYTFYKYCCVYTGKDAKDPFKASLENITSSLQEGYEKLLNRHIKTWARRWEQADIQIDGDDEAQFALRYSIYHLLAIAPRHSERVSIPARGLSGQVYKGAVFWDTELFMLPFFLYTDPKTARNLVAYRIHTLDGARSKANEYGYRGAFYAWESQETGNDACTHFNVTDVFTGRPIRTYFRDKQIHISADVAFGIWTYHQVTGDDSILLEGGAAVILECARFFYSYAYLNKSKNRYEILDVTGPDEYHERVNNNFYTNVMVKHTLDVALKVIELLKERYAAAFFELIEALDYSKDMDNIFEMRSLLFVPQPSEKDRLIAQFDGYHQLEDISLVEIKKRILHPSEYLGGGNGLASTTRIIKQADVVLGLGLFKEQYSYDVKKANWEYYEPRTEHGSSLSACAYALLAADIGKSEWAYPYFVKTATIDLTGESKQYVGNLYIGGTHPAANGGAWITAIHGLPVLATIATM